MNIFKDAKYEDVPEDMRERVLSRWLDNNYEPIVDEEKKTKHSSIFIYGDVGTGKTHICKAISAKFTEKFFQNYVYMVNFTDLMFKAQSRTEKDMDVADHKGLLIIDDLGARNPSEFVVDTIYRIINTRYENAMPTIITSNLSLQEIDVVFGKRISSRIDRMCTIYKM